MPESRDSCTCCSHTDSDDDFDIGECKTGSCDQTAPVPDIITIHDESDDEKKSATRSKKRKAREQDAQLELSKRSYETFVEHAYQLAMKVVRGNPIDIYRRLVGNFMKGHENGKLTVVRYADILKSMDDAGYMDEAAQVRSKNSLKWRKSLLRYLECYIADKEIDIMDCIKQKIDNPQFYVRDVLISDGVFIMIS